MAVTDLINKNKQTVLYGVALAAVLFLLKWLEIRLLIIDHAMEVYMGVIALVFTSLGIWLALRLAKPKVQTVVVEKTIYKENTGNFIANEQEIDRLNISKRELEVLQLMCDGLSNQEISARLFVSLNTVKTHTSNLFDKMEVKRRTQAVEAAKRLGIIA